MRWRSLLTLGNLDLFTSEEPELERRMTDSFLHTLAQAASSIYAAGGRAPGVYPWVNEPGGGTLPPWSIERRLIVFTG